MFCHAQADRARLKANALMLPAGILNAGVEMPLSEHYALQADVTVSPWKSAFGNHAQAYFGILEGRYYFKKSLEGWYVGAHAGTGIFDLTKWNYVGTHKFQRGFNVLLGVSVGYQFQYSERWNIDIFAGGGSVQSWYHGYATLEEPPGFYRYDGAHGWNKSGELLPYRGGIMISYKLKP